MKPNLTIVLMLGIFFSACQSSLQITKKKYRPGYYVHFNPGKLKTSKLRVEKKEDADMIFPAVPKPVHISAGPEKVKEDFPVTAGLQSMVHKRKVRHEVSSTPGRMNFTSVSDTTKSWVALPKKSQKDNLKLKIAIAATLMLFISIGLSFLVFLSIFFSLLISSLIINIAIMASSVFFLLALSFSLVSIFIKADQPSKSLLAKILAWSTLLLSVGIFLLNVIFMVVFILILMFSSGLS